MSKKSRTRYNRRDRRKAKQSNWQRPGRGNPKKVGHGGSGQTQSTMQSGTSVPLPPDKPKNKLKYLTMTELFNLYGETKEEGKRAQIWEEIRRRKNIEE